MGHSKIVLLQVVVGVSSLVNSVQTNGSVPMPLHKRDLDVQARGTHRKSDSVRKFCMTLDIIRHSLKGRNGKQIIYNF
jgi:hypothetical protein